MNKEQIIANLKEQITLGNITKEELLSIVQETSGQDSGFSQQNQEELDESNKKNLSEKLTQIFYVIGGIVVLAGIVVLVAQNWTEIGFAGRVTSSVGISLITYIVGLLFRKPENSILSQIMFTVSAATAPLGALVLINEVGIEPTFQAQLLIATILLIIFGFAFFVSRRPVLSVISVAFATWAYYTLLLNLLGNEPEIMRWATIVLGFAYTTLAVSYRLEGQNKDEVKEKKAARNLIAGAGLASILGAGITFDAGLLFILYIALIFGAFYYGLYMRSRLALIISAIFLVSYIIRLTMLYFAYSVGWPVALIFIGFVVIGVGYLTFYLNKRFISGKKNNEEMHIQA